MIHSKSLGQHKFFSLIFAATANMVLEVLMLMVDTVLAGHTAGEAGISAMNVMTPVVNFMDFTGDNNSYRSIHLLRCSYGQG